MRQEIIKACQHLLKHGPFDKKEGICYNVIHYFELLHQDCGKEFKEEGIVIALLWEIFRSWEHYSGDNGFPVPSPAKNQGPCDYYIYNKHAIWQGEQLEYRISLLNHIIKELSK